MTILYADDDDEDQEVFAEIIREIDPKIRIIRAKDGLQTIELLSIGSAPDIIFLDFNMPFLNGHQTVLKIREEEQFADIKVVMFSTSLFEPAHEGFASLNVLYARKPNTIQEGVQTLKAIIHDETVE